MENQGSFMESLTKICSLAELKKLRSFGFNINNIEGFVVSDSTGNTNEVYAYRNACPHIGMNLEFKEHQFLDPDKRFIQCSMHGALFELKDGKCVHGPCLNQHLAAIKTHLIDENVWVELT